MDNETLQALIERVSFRKTTYIEAHEYIVREWNEECQALHEALSRLIAEEGYSRKFYGRTYRYMNLGGYRYWIMGVILNRARLEEEEEREQA